MSERPLTRNIDMSREPYDLLQYRQAQGYEAVLRMLREHSPADVLEMVKNSGLKGRGGAGSPTGLKWSFVPTG